MLMVRKAKDLDEDLSSAFPVTRPGSDTAWLENLNRALPARIWEGSVHSGPDAFLYGNDVLCVPGPYDQMTIYNSTQNPNGNQASVARGARRVVESDLRSRRAIGGGLAPNNIGLSCPRQAAVAARRLGRPAIAYDRATD
jgi:xanthine dehydrogenase/oxidase